MPFYYTKVYYKIKDVLELRKNIGLFLDRGKGERMTNIFIALIFLGIIFVISGVITLHYPDWEWKWSLKRMLFVGDGEPTELYYRLQKISAVINIVGGIVIIFIGAGRIISHNITGGKQEEKKGFTVYVDRQEISLPCTYEDIQNIDFKLCKGEKLENILPNDQKSIMVSNSDGEIIKIYFRNTTQEEKPMEECAVYKRYAQYSVQTYEFMYDNPEDLVNGNYYTLIGSTDVDEGPYIELDNGFSSECSGDRATEILGKGSTGVSGKYKIYTLQDGQVCVNLTVGYGGLSWDDEISFITIECQ